MKNHLSQDQLAKSFVGYSATAELQHLNECLECRAELSRFRDGISSFRDAVRTSLDARIDAAGLRTRAMPQVTIRWTWRWVLAAAAALILIVMPPFAGNKRESPKPVEESSTLMSPDALMNAVSFQVSRAVPAPMERAIALMPREESITESGGVQ